MILDRHANPVVLCGLYGVAKHCCEATDLGFVGLLSEDETAADNSHHSCSNGTCAFKTGKHVPVGVLILSSFESIGVTPGVDTLELILVEHSFQIAEILSRILRKETRFKRYAIHPEFVGAHDEIFHRHASGRARLLRINLAEVTMKAIVIDSDEHGFRLPS